MISFEPSLKRWNARKNSLIEYETGKRYEILNSQVRILDISGSYSISIYFWSIKYLYVAENTLEKYICMEHTEAMRRGLDNYLKLYPGREHTNISVYKLPYKYLVFLVIPNVYFDINYRKFWTASTINILYIFTIVKISFLLCSKTFFTLLSRILFNLSELMISERILWHPGSGFQIIFFRYIKMCRIWYLELIDCNVYWTTWKFSVLPNWADDRIIHYLLMYTKTFFFYSQWNLIILNWDGTSDYIWN